jgi:hypothetical protein
MFLIGLTLNPAVIAPAASLSGPVSLGALPLVGIAMPAVWTAAALTFQVSPDGGTTWLELYDGAGNEVTLMAAAGQFVMPGATYAWAGINMLKVRSGTAAAAVTQTPGATINLISRPETF